MKRDLKLWYRIMPLNTSFVNHCKAALNDIACKRMQWFQLQKKWLILNKTEHVPSFCDDLSCTCDLKYMVLYPDILHTT